MGTNQNQNSETPKGVGVETEVSASLPINNNYILDEIEIGKEYDYKEDWIVERVKLLAADVSGKTHSFTLLATKSGEEYSVGYNAEVTGYASGMWRLYPKHTYLP